MSDISAAPQEPRCPHCMKPFHGSFPEDGDETPVTCPACGETSPAAAWFVYEPDPDDVVDLDE